MQKVLIVPGLYDSGADHWQTWLEGRIDNAQRVKQRDWSSPHLESWRTELVNHLRTMPPDSDIILVAHSFGCLASHMAAQCVNRRIAGVLFVAPADPLHFDIGEELLLDRLPCPSILVASSNDPWMPLARAQHFGHRWGSRFVNLGEAGHINAESGHGAWLAGLRFLQQLAPEIEVTNKLVAPAYPLNIPHLPSSGILSL